jgi:glycosyltransferase involved in cell wall biosynthesis
MTAHPQTGLSLTPLVSVGMPVYNTEGSIAGAIESIQAQTYTRTEIVICDNGSTDRTREICLRYAERDPRIRYSCNPTNIGKEPNFLRVLELATGEYFLWHCGDDVRPSDSLERLMIAMRQSPDAVMAHGPVIEEAAGTRNVLANAMDLTGPHAAQRVRAYVKGLQHNGMQYGLYKRSVLHRAYATSDFITNHYGHDFHLCLQMCLFGRVEYSLAPMVVYREHGSVPNRDPMGRGRAVTVSTMLGGHRAMLKAWITLLYGCYNLMRPREVPLRERIPALGAFAWAFIGRYGGRLLRDGILIVTHPMRWLLSCAWPMARRAPVILAFGRKIKARYIVP